MADTYPETDRLLPPVAPKTPRGKWFLFGMLSGIILLGGTYFVWEAPTGIKQYFKAPSHPYGAYLKALEQSKLTESSMYKAWVQAGEDALTHAPILEAPYLESGYISTTEQAALGFRINPANGQVLSVKLEITSTIDSPQVFIDLFELRETGENPYELVAFADSGSYTLVYEVEKDQSYMLRIQPELMARFSYRLEVVLSASLAFPVAGKDSRAIKSFWGAPRDGGRRLHKGIDIFAKKGTPVLAATDGRISNVRNGGLGGKVVWQRDAYQAQTLYYAHLDTQWVRGGEQVKKGDTLGLVGNTGNARTTPPHLHFGIYQRRRGAVDPFPFVNQPNQQAPTIRASENGMLNWFKSNQTLSIYPSSKASRDSVLRIPPDTPFKRLAAQGSFHLVQLPDGTKGYVLSQNLLRMDAPLSTTILPETYPILDQFVAGVKLDQVEKGEAVELLAAYHHATYIRTASGIEGWINWESE